MSEPAFDGPTVLWLELCRRALRDFDTRSDYADRNVNGDLVISRYIQENLK